MNFTHTGDSDGNLRHTEGDIGTDGAFAAVEGTFRQAIYASIQVQEPYILASSPCTWYSFALIVSATFLYAIHANRLFYLLRAPRVRLCLRSFVARRAIPIVNHLRRKHSIQSEPGNKAVEDEFVVHLLQGGEDTRQGACKVVEYLCQMDQQVQPSEQSRHDLQRMQRVVLSHPLGKW